MMKKLAVLLIALFVLAGGASFVSATTFAPTPSQERNETVLVSEYQKFLDAKEATPMGGNYYPGCCLLKADLEVMGNHASDGDTFVARVSVTNVGSQTAYYVLGFLTAEDKLGLPSGWTIENNDGHNYMVWESIAPGETKTFDFVITRDAEDATILFKAFGKNCPKTSSNHVRIPINPLVVGGVTATMVGMYSLSRKRKGKDY